MRERERQRVSTECGVNYKELQAGFQRLAKKVLYRVPEHLEPGSQRAAAGNALEGEEEDPDDRRDERQYQEQGEDQNMLPAAFALFVLLPNVNGGLLCIRESARSNGPNVWDCAGEGSGQVLGHGLEVHHRVLPLRLAVRVPKEGEEEKRRSQQMRRKGTEGGGEGLT